MGRKIEEVEGIGPAYAQKLNGAGVKTDGDLLDTAASAKGRMELAARTGIRTGLILKWANHVDLMRLTGVGPQFAELLEETGVDTVKELAHRNAANLAAKLGEVNEQKHLAGSSPAESQVSAWIAEAKKLAPKISH